MWTAIVAAISKALDITGQVLGFLFKRWDKREQKKEDAQKRMDEAAKKGDFDAFEDAHADKHNA